MADISSVDPRSLPPEGGTTIVITGTGFQANPDKTKVYLRDVNYRELSVKSFKIDSDTQITAVTPVLDNTRHAYVCVEVNGIKSTTLTEDFTRGTPDAVRYPNRVEVEFKSGLLDLVMDIGNTDISLDLLKKNEETQPLRQGIGPLSSND